MLVQDRLLRLRENGRSPAYEGAVRVLESTARIAMAVQYEISSVESANWGHYYSCHDDGSKLIFRWDRPDEHECSYCGKIWQGEPFDSARRYHVHNQLGVQAKALGALWAIQGKAEAAERLKSILLGYAGHYRGYPVHGDIPYNGPGKLFAQTLDEAHWIHNLALAYVLGRELFTEEDSKLLRDGLFLPCARFLTEQKEQQLHNHAVWITSAIAAVGVVLGERETIDSGLNGRFGLLDQLERGVLSDGLWYEGAFHYHFYALAAVISYGLLAEGTEWDLRGHPSIRKMFDLPLRYILPDGTFPCTNDMHPGYGAADVASAYEAAYEWFGADAFGCMLQQVYGAGKDRASFEALVFGRELTSETPAHERGFASPNWTIANGGPVPVAQGSSGLIIMRGPDDLHLTVKATPFGGEHDHMDRLGLSFGAGGQGLFIDPGTTAYGVPVHYGWFKHTYSHNTFGIEGKDQPPADAVLVQCHQEEWGSWMEARVEWALEDFRYRKKDDIVLPEHQVVWDLATYAGACGRRVSALLANGILVDAVKVTVPEPRTIDNLFHISGVLQEGAGQDWLSDNTAISSLSGEMYRNQARTAAELGSSLLWGIGDTGMLYHSGRMFLAGGSVGCGELIRADTPDNPPNRSRQTLVQRLEGTTEAVFVNVFRFRSFKDADRSPVEGIDGEVRILPDSEPNEASGSDGTHPPASLTIEIGSDTSADAVGLRFRLIWGEEKAVFRSV